jgi:transposase
MVPRFKDCDRDTLFLMPPSVNDWVPENHLSRFVVDIVNRLDLSPIINAYAGRGSDAYPPSMMVALLFLCLCNRGLFQQEDRTVDL